MSEVEKIRQSGRDSIIRHALTLLNRNVDLENMTVRVFASDTEVYVSINTPYLYIPVNSHYCYGVSIFLLTGTVAYNTIANPEGCNPGSDIIFYEQNEEDKVNLQFAVDAIEKQEGVPVT